jgi:hypothetical protein
MLTNMLLGKLSMQLKVQRLLALRAAAKEQRTSSLTAAASSAGGGSSAVAATSVSTRGGGGDDGVGRRLVSNPAAHLQSCIRELASVLKEATKPEEGAQCWLGGGQKSAPCQTCACVCIAPSLGLAFA